jgi:hypothetical protein
MGHGYPLSGVVTTNELAHTFAAGPMYFNTFAGSNAACASGLAVLKAISELGLQENAWIVGKRLLAGLIAIQKAYPNDVGDVRGQGLFVGIELVTSSMCKGPSPGKAMWLKERMKTKQVRALQPLVSCLCSIAVAGPPSQACHSLRAVEHARPATAMLAGGQACCWNAVETDANELGLCRFSYRMMASMPTCSRSSPQWCSLVRTPPPCSRIYPHLCKRCPQLVQRLKPCRPR